MATACAVELSQNRNIFRWDGPILRIQNDSGGGCFQVRIQVCFVRMYPSAFLLIGKAPEMQAFKPQCFFEFQNCQYSLNQNKQIYIKIYSLKNQ